MTTRTISYSEARNSLASVIDEAVNDVRPIVISRRGKRNAIIISEDEYNSLQETLYLLSGKNGNRLRESKEQIERGECRTISLDEIKSMSK